MKTGLVSDRRFLAHRPPVDHPECPDRLEAIATRLSERGLTGRMQPVAAREASRAELALAHQPAWLAALERLVTAHGGWGYLDGDTYFSPESWPAALLAAGGTVNLARAVLLGQLDDGIALVRPPGHHATRQAAMGFCLLNNVAVAAAALAAEGARVAIIDFDVHHGNGTQDIFWTDPRVLYCSTHEFPLYPGTGAASERGAGAGLGATVNVPLPPGTGDAGLLAAYDEVILPAVARFAPDLMLVSAGFDAHERDPLASLQVSTGGFARLGRRLRQAAGGRLAAVLEGGYDLEALADSVAAFVEVLLGAEVPEGAPIDRGALREEERRAITVAGRSLSELPPPPA